MTFCPRHGLKYWAARFYLWTEDRREQLESFLAHVRVERDRLKKERNG